MSAFALTYLLDVLLQYANAGGGIDHGENVMQGYWSLLERRASWMAA